MMENEKDIYHQEGIENCMDDDEISQIEEGFMRGYLSTV